VGAGTIDVVKRLAALAALTTLAAPASAADVPADPSNYEQLFASLGPGDRLLLAPGDYTGGLTISGVEGADDMPIVIEGPADMSARFVGRSCCNTIDIENSAYVTLRNLRFDGNGKYVDAIKAGGAATSWSHHITIEGCLVENHDVGQTAQQAVGFSTKTVAWDWVVRGNVIDGAGTGMYFGNSDGSAAFIGGLVEGNLFLDTLGYNMQVKHQLAREAAPGVPTEPSVIVIRHNVFIKSDNPSPDGARPNLLVGGFPDSGDGSLDRYEIYGNVFYHNKGDALLQATGRVSIHDNVFVDGSFAAINATDHSGKSMIDALVYHNTIYGVSTGIQLDAPSGTELVAANAIFADTALSGVSVDLDNVSDSSANAASYVNNPSATLGDMDFYPIAGSALRGSVVDLAAAAGDLDHDRDFNGSAKDFSYRGAYHGEGTNPGWPLDAERKPLPDGGAGGGPSSSGAGGAGGAGSEADDGAGAREAGDDGGCGCVLRGAGGEPPLVALAAFLALVRRRRATARPRRRS
jgi:hypothetical protein